MNHAINLLAVIPMRKEPSHRSEMVSQILFGEYSEIIEEEKEFKRVRCSYDGYEGWVQATQLTEVSEVLHTDDYVCSWNDKVLINGRHINIPMCSPVYDVMSKSVTINDTEVQYILALGSLWNIRENEQRLALLENIYTPFLDTPYLWGGKSVFGIDCSGFVQQVFKMFGIKLLRDAYLQATQGSEVNNLQEAQRGDLAFFQNEDGRITHVGIILKDKQIVHASGKVRIDSIDEQGIVNSETGKRTHHLHSIKKLF